MARPSRPEDERQAVYRWLFRTRFKNAQDSRIYRCSKSKPSSRSTPLGAPRLSVQPPRAVARDRDGSAGDRPADSRIAGIIVNDGVRLRSARIERLHFAAAPLRDAPHASARRRRTRDGAGSRGGPARRAVGSRRRGPRAPSRGRFHATDGTAVKVGGKTGTGDNRMVVSGSRGVALNRTHLRVLLGPRHFGR